MTEVRKHQRQTASGKRTTVRHHTRDGGKMTRREEEAEVAREAEADRAAPHVSTLQPAEPAAQDETWWDDEPQWSYCDCAGSHRPGCPNDRPGGLPPLTDDDDG